MSTHATTRRTFLRLSGLGLAATATAKVSSPLPFPSKDDAGSRPAGDIAGWVTSGNQHLARVALSAWHASAGNPGERAVMLDPGRQFQERVGFGAALPAAPVSSSRELLDTA